MQVDIDLTELAKLNQTIASLQLKAEDINAIAPGIRILLQEDVDLRFDSSPPVEVGGDVYGGEDWAPVQGRYLRDRPDRLGGQLLRDTVELQQSFSAGLGYYGVTDSSIKFGSILPKAGRLNRDRPIVFWHPELLAKVADFIVGVVVDV
jgi:hypothetical protein